MSKDDDELLLGTVPGEPPWSKASNLGRLEQRVSNVETALRDIKNVTLRDIKEDFKGLREQITELHRAILNIGKPQYGVISGFAGVVLLGASLLWGLAITPVKDDIGRLYSLSEKTNLKFEDAEKLLDTKKADILAIESLRLELKARIEELNARLKRQ